MLNVLYTGLPNLMELFNEHGAVVALYFGNTIKLMAGVGLTTIFLGVSCSWLVSVFDFPFRNSLSWMLILPLTIPTYVIAFIYTDIIELSGSLLHIFGNIVGIEMEGKSYVDGIRSVTGAVAFFSFVLYPYIYILTRVSFSIHSANYRNAVRMSGRGVIASFFTVELLLAAPAMMAGAILVLAETINDYGAVDYFGIYTLSAGIFDIWLNKGELGQATALTVISIVLVVLLMILTKIVTGSAKKYAHSKNEPFVRIRLQGWQAWSVSGFVSLPFLLGFFIPFFVICRYALSVVMVGQYGDILARIRDSLLVSVNAAALCLFLSLTFGIIRRFHHKPSIRLITNISSLNYALPSAVLAIGFLGIWTFFDTGIEYLNALGLSPEFYITGGLFSLIAAHACRFLSVANSNVFSNYRNINIKYDMVSFTMGKSKIEIFKDIHSSLLKQGLIYTFLAVFVDSLKELPATLLLRPFDYNTLSTNIYEQMKSEQIVNASLPAFFLILIGALPIIIFSRDKVLKS